MSQSSRLLPSSHEEAQSWPESEHIELTVSPSQVLQLSLRPSPPPKSSSALTGQKVSQNSSQSATTPARAAESTNASSATGPAAVPKSGVPAASNSGPRRSTTSAHGPSAYRSTTVAPAPARCSRCQHHTHLYQLPQHHGLLCYSCATAGYQTLLRRLEILR